MAGRRRSDQGPGTIIWPGFVDAMTALLLVLMFVLSIFMVVQFVLREELIGKDRTLDQLNATLAALNTELANEQQRAEGFRSRVANLEELLAEEEARALQLGRDLAASEERSAELTDELERRIAELAATAQALEDRDAELADLQARSAEIAAIEAENRALQQAAAASAATQLTLEERIAALELALDQKRAEAEETLLLLAAAETKQRELSQEAVAAAEAMSERERLNAFARAALQAEREQSSQNRAAIALLNGQIRDLRNQISALELQLRLSERKDAQNQIVIENLGQRLNQALARKVDELQRYRSEFFGRLRDLLAGRDDIRVVGDRFVFQSEVLFASGSAELGSEGRGELSKFAAVLRGIASEIPSELPWILRVDGHTDRVPIGPSSPYSGNWELSQARALSVVDFLINAEGIPPARLAAAGFGEHQPLSDGDTREDFMRNRRIELKLTER